MMPKEWVKDPMSKWYLSFNAAKTLAAGDAIASVVAKMYDGATDVSAAMIVGSPTIISPEVFIWVQAGTDLKDYLLQLQATTNMGEKIVESLKIRVRSIAV